MSYQTSVRMLQLQPARPYFEDRYVSMWRSRVWELTLFVRSKAAVSRYRSRESAGLSRQSLIHSSILFCSSKILALFQKIQLRTESVGLTFDELQSKHLALFPELLEQSVFANGPKGSPCVKCF